jgi:arginase
MIVRTLRLLSHFDDDSPRNETTGSARAVVQKVKGDATLISEAGANSSGLPLTVIDQENGALVNSYLPAAPGESNARYVRHFADRLPKLAESLRAACEQACQEQARIISVGGNHITAIELLGYLQYCEQHNFEPIVVWWDAHLDCNTPTTSETGNVHGMVAALLLGEGPEELKAHFQKVRLPRPENIIFVGSNSEDGPELALINSFPEGKRPVFIPARQYGGGGTLQDELKKRVEATPGSKIWMELDMDAIYEGDAPGVVMQNSTGMTGVETHRFISWLAKDMSEFFLGMRITEICLANDTDDRTVHLAKNLILAAVGIENRNYHLDGCQRPQPADNRDTVRSFNSDGFSVKNGPISRLRKLSSYIALVGAAWVASVGGLIWSYSGGRRSSHSSKIAATAPIDPVAAATSFESKEKDALIASLIEKLKNQEHQHILLNGSKIDSPAIDRGDKHKDTQYMWTGIHSTNRFVPINYAGDTIHSVDTLIDIAKTYLEIARREESFEGQLDRERDRIYSCLVAAELNGEIEGHWKALKNFFLENDRYRGREVFFDLSADYGSFKRAINIEEVKKYLVLQLQ